MPAVSFPQVNTYRSEFPRLDFSALANLPNAFWQGQQVSRENQARQAVSEALRRGDIPAAAAALSAANPAAGLTGAISNERTQQAGMLTPYQALSLQLQQQIANQGRVPPGYERSDTGMKAIAGGPADPSVVAANKRAELQSKALIGQPAASLKLGTFYDTMDRLSADAQTLKNDPHLWQAVGTIGAVPGITGSPSEVTKEKIRGLASRAGMAALQAMRDASKTGGAVGQVSNFEQQLFQQQMANINEKLDEGNFKAAMDQLSAYTQAAKDRMATAYQETYGEPYAPKESGQTLTTDPRGAYLPEQGQPQGMNRQAAPEGTIISNGDKTLIKRNGQWVPM